MARSTTTRNLTRTAAGAHQYSNTGDMDRRRSLMLSIKARLTDDLRDLSEQGFREKYGMSFNEAYNRVNAMNDAGNAQHLRGITGGQDNSSSRLHDQFEKTSAGRYAKGGVVKKKPATKKPSAKKAAPKTAKKATPKKKK